MILLFAQERFPVSILSPYAPVPRRLAADPLIPLYHAAALLEFFSASAKTVGSNINTRGAEVLGYREDGNV